MADTLRVPVASLEAFDRVAGLLKADVDVVSMPDHGLERREVTLTTDGGVELLLFVEAALVVEPAGEPGTAVRPPVKTTRKAHR